MRLLIVKTTNSDVTSAVETAKSHGCKVIMADNIEDALQFLRNGKGSDLILIDAKMDISSLVQSLSNERISVPVVSYGIKCDPKDAINSIKAGAKEFISLPPDKKLIVAILNTISNKSSMITGNSNPMKSVMQISDKIAKSNANILLTGKSGTGKEMLANYIHNNSERANSSFVRVNCAAIPEHLLESELFGHEKGAFTGALTRRIGKFEESSGGTLLLDEISEMDTRLQAKLLRAIQEKEIDRVGGNSPVKIDLRIIATSNRDLQEEIAKNNFREDLYFRLNTITIELPNLNQRIEDIEELSNHFISKYVMNNQMKPKALSKEALSKLQMHPWPGNIRELENVMHRAVLLSSGDVIVEGDIQMPTKQFVGKKISEAEKELVTNTMNYCLGDLNKASEILGISIAMLENKLEVYKKSNSYNNQ
ncbi:MAG: sigma-54-dependent transcriptional regulator [Rickettsiaceae bacterium]